MRRKTFPKKQVRKKLRRTELFLSSDILKKPFEGLFFLLHIHCRAAAAHGVRVRRSRLQRRIIHQTVRNTVAFGGNLNSFGQLSFFAQFKQTVDDPVAQRPRIYGIDENFRNGFKPRRIADTPLD